MKKLVKIAKTKGSKVTAKKAGTLRQGSAQAIRPGKVLSAPALRKRAEKITLEKAAPPTKKIEKISEAEVKRVLQELRVHQIALMVQNEELRQTQAELVDAKVRYFDLYDLAPVGYITISEKGVIREANLTAATLLDVPKKKLKEHILARFIHKEDQDNYYRHRKELFETGEPQKCELRMMKKDKTAFWAYLEATLAKDEGGASVCRAMLSDITERKRQDEEKAKLAVQTLQLQKAESLACMANGTIHHFNNLLQAIIGNMQLAIQMMPQDSKSIKNMTAAIEAARIAQEISHKTMTYLGESTANLEPLDLADLCRLLLLNIQATIPKNILLKTDIPLNVPTINANTNQIQQLLINLITNAREAIGDARGVISLRVKTVLDTDIPPIHRPTDWRKRGSVYICLKVSDTGSGIAQSDIHKLFDPFFSSKLVGRGLGLPVVLGIVKVHHGAIAVQSEPGQGSTFRVFLPATEGE